MKWILPSIIITILIIGGIFFFYQKAPTGAVTTTQGGSFQCPDIEGYYCRAIPFLECTLPPTEEGVIFRTTDIDYDSGTIAIDIYKTGLVSYKSTTRKSTGCNRGILLPIKAPPVDLYDVYLDGNDLWVCKETDGNYRRYMVGGNANLDPSPTDCEYTETCIETTQCEEDIIINDQIISTLTANPQETIQGQTITLQKGDTIKFSRIDYEIFFEEPQETQCTTSLGVLINIGDSVCTSETKREYCELEQGQPILKTETATGKQICINGIIQCSASECLFDGFGQILPDGTGYYKCKTDQQGCQFIDFSDITYCDEGELFDETELICKPPYKVTLTLDKTILGTEEMIIGEIKLSDTTDKNQIPIRITIKDDNKNEIASIDKLTNNFGSASFALNPIQNIGDYILTAKIFHSDGTQEKKLSFKVVAQLQLILEPDPDFTQFENEPIKIIASVTSGFEPEKVKTWVIDAKFEDNPVSYNIIPISKGVVGISSDVNGEGELQFDIYAIDESGFETETKTIKITVKTASIYIDMDISKANNKEKGSYTISFSTTTPDNKLLNTNNEVTITLPNTCKSGEFCTAKNKQIPKVSLIGKNGQYSFIWNFEDSGNYIIEISSYASGFELSKAIPTTVNIKEKQIDINWMPFVLGGLVFIIAIIIIIVLIKRKR